MLKLVSHAHRNIRQTIGKPIIIIIQDMGNIYILHHIFLNHTEHKDVATSSTKHEQLLHTAGVLVAVLQFQT